MRILFVSAEYPPETGRGGIGTYTHVTAHALAARGHAVEVIALSERETPYVQEDGPVRIHRVGPGFHPLPAGRLLFRYRALCRRLWPHTLIRLAFAGSVRDKAAALMAERAFDIVESPECGAEGALIRPVSGCRTVVRLHTPFSMAARLDQIPMGFWDLRKTERIEREAARRARGISSPTRALAAILRGRWRLGPVTVYPNPLDLGSEPPPAAEGDDRIVYTGRVEYRKGVHVLLKAFAQLVKSGFPHRLLLVGAPYGGLKGGRTYGGLIEELAVRLGVAGRMEWIRGADRAKVRALLSGAAAAVYPSVWENFPYACLEAMAAGLPVVASRIGGYPEMIEDGGSGILFNPLDADDLALKLSALLRDDSRRAALGAAARRRVAAAFGSETVAAAAERFYGEVLNG